MNKTYDAIVIGAGAIGTSCAYHLVKKGLTVALIERRDIARGTSSRCDAAALLSDKQPGVDVALGYASILRFLELQKELSTDFVLHQGGSLYVCETEQQMEIAAGFVKQMQAEGYDFSLQSRAEIREREPFLADDLAGGFWSSACCSLNPFKLCYAFVDEVNGKGLDVYIHTSVTGILRGEAGEVTGVETDRGTFHTKHVINACGAWAPDVGKMVGLDLPIIPRKGIILVSGASSPICHQKVQEYGYNVTKFEKKGVRQDPDVERYNVSFNIEPTEGNNVIVGGSRNFVGFTETPEIEVVKAIARRAVRFFPVLKKMNIIRTYAGVRPYVKEHLPLITDVKGVPGYYIAAGHEGDGISMAPTTGQLIAEIVTGETPHMDVKPFSYSRYER